MYSDQLTQPVCMGYNDLTRPICTVTGWHGMSVQDTVTSWFSPVCTEYSDQLVSARLYREQWLAGPAQSVQSTVTSRSGPVCTGYNDKAGITRPVPCTVYFVHTISRLKLSCVVYTTLFWITKCWYFLFQNISWICNTSLKRFFFYLMTCKCAINLNITKMYLIHSKR